MRGTLPPQVPLLGDLLGIVRRTGRG